MNLQKQTKGNKVTVDFGDGKEATFTAGCCKRYLVDEDPHAPGVGYVVVNGEVRFADGSTAYALIEIDECSSGEHGGTGIFLPNGDVLFQSDEGFKEALVAAGVTEAFPYQYRYQGAPRCNDHHVGDDGWSLR